MRCASRTPYGGQLGERAIGVVDEGFVDVGGGRRRPPHSGYAKHAGLPREPQRFSTLADRVRNADAIGAHAFWMMRGEIALWSWGLDGTCAFDETDDCLRT